MPERRTALDRSATSVTILASIRPETLTMGTRMTDPADPHHTSDREFALFNRAKAIPPQERRAFVARSSR